MTLGEGVVGHGVGRSASGAYVITVYVVRGSGAEKKVPSHIDGVATRVEFTSGFVAY